MDGSAILWIGFLAIIVSMLVLDLTVIHRKAHSITFREAAFWSGVWVVLALLFNGAVYWLDGREKALNFFTGYLLELSLSVDNLFVFVLIFEYFRIPPVFQSRVLHWGIIGAQIMRMAFIFMGVALIQTFHWMIYVFGALLLYTGVKLAVGHSEAPDPGKNPALKFFKRVTGIPFSAEFDGQKFLTIIGERIHATPLMATLIVVEFSDVIFAIDSIPAIIAITPDPFIVYTSNIFAISGLRAMYFLLSGLIGMFRYLGKGIALILCFIGVKMLISHFYHIPIGTSLSVIAAVLAVSIAASVLADKREKAGG